MEASQVATETSRDEFRELAGLIHDLDRRVRALEQATPVSRTLPAPPLSPELRISSELLPTIGKALLAIAGAFVLRALTEAHFWPPKAGVLAGLLYAAFWLWRAMQIESRLAATINVITSLVILIPLIVEATVGLQILPTWAAAATLVAWSIAPILQRNLAAIVSTAIALTGFGLLMATHDLLPFTLALIIIAAASDWAVLPAHWFAAFCATAAVAIQTMIVAKPLPEGYAPVSRGQTILVLALLFAAFAGRFAIRAASRDAVSFYEIGKTAVAIVVSIGGLLFLTRADLSLGTLALIAGAACYALAFRGAYPSRNRSAFAGFAALLSASGIFLLLPLPLATVAFCLFATGISRTTLGATQAPVFLWTAIAISGVATGSALVLFGTAQDFPRFGAGVILAAAAVVQRRMDRAPACVVVLAGLAWAASGLAASLGAGSVVLPAVALLLAWAGLKWRRGDPIWMMYAVMIVGAAKIVIHDFAYESTVMLVISLLAYGAALIALPRIVPRTQ